MRIRTFGLAIGLMVALIAAAPVAAAPTASSQPDGRIRLQKVTSEHFPTEKYTRTWIGNNKYNTTAYRQTAREAWCCETPGWQHWIFGVSVQNDGTSSDRIRVHATGTALEGWTVKYFHGPTNITAAVVAGTFTTPSLAPGGDYLVKVDVRRDGDTNDTDNLRRLISLTSVGNPSKADAVKLVIRHVVVCTC
jgi:hypothetical protein